jgi:hypothetical protein
MKVLGTLLLAIGLWYGFVFGVGVVLDPSTLRDPIVGSAVVDGACFAALGAGLLGLDRLGQRKRPVERAEEVMPPREEA